MGTADEDELRLRRVCREREGLKCIKAHKNRQTEHVRNVARTRHETDVDVAG